MLKVTVDASGPEPGALGRILIVVAAILTGGIVVVAVRRGREARA